jgi:Pyruvate/2-oxoacid:ferredoxin oxidoreductase gamma subunit
MKRTFKACTLIVAFLFLLTAYSVAADNFDPFDQTQVESLVQKKCKLLIKKGEMLKAYKVTDKKTMKADGKAIYKAGNKMMSNAMMITVFGECDQILNEAAEEMLRAGRMLVKEANNKEAMPDTFLKKIAHEGQIMVSKGNLLSHEAGGCY